MPSDSSMRILSGVDLKRAPLDPSRRPSSRYPFPCAFHTTLSNVYVRCVARCAVRLSSLFDVGHAMKEPTAIIKSCAVDDVDPPTAGRYPVFPLTPERSCRGLPEWSPFFDRHAILTLAQAKLPCSKMPIHTFFHQGCLALFLSMS